MCGSGGGGGGGGGAAEGEEETESALSHSTTLDAIQKGVANERGSERARRRMRCSLQAEDSESRLWGGVIIAITAKSSSEKTF